MASPPMTVMNGGCKASGVHRCRADSDACSHVEGWGDAYEKTSDGGKEELLESLQTVEQNLKCPM